MKSHDKSTELKDDIPRTNISLVEMGKENICAFLAGYVLASMPIESLFLL